MSFSAVVKRKEKELEKDMDREGEMEGEGEENVEFEEEKEVEVVKKSVKKSIVFPELSFSGGRMFFDIEQAKNVPVAENIRNMTGLWSGKKNENESKILWKNVNKNQNENTNKNAKTFT